MHWHFHTITRDIFIFIVIYISINLYWHSPNIQVWSNIGYRNITTTTRKEKVWVKKKVKKKKKRRYIYLKNMCQMKIKQSFIYYFSIGCIDLHLILYDIQCLGSQALITQLYMHSCYKVRLSISWCLFWINIYFIQFQFAHFIFCYSMFYILFDFVLLICQITLQNYFDIMSVIGLLNLLWIKLYLEWISFNEIGSFKKQCVIHTFPHCLMFHAIAWGTTNWQIDQINLINWSDLRLISSSPLYNVKLKVNS